MMRSRLTAAPDICAYLLLLFFCPTLAHTQPLPTDWQKAVVLIEKQVKVDENVQHSAIGTGFLVRANLEASKSSVYLVTAKHVLVALLTRGPDFLVRVDSRGGGFTRIPMRLLSGSSEKGDVIIGTRASEAERGQKWGFHKQFDIAVIDASDVQVPSASDHRVFAVELLATKQAFDSLGLAETDATFIIVYDSGFDRRLVRSGIISSMLPPGSFLMEARNLPGDSGSPVVLQPTLTRKPGVIQPTQPLIIGLVSEVYSRLVPIGKFGTGSTDLLFPQPMNLSLVQPSYRILEVLAGLR